VESKKVDVTELENRVVVTRGRGQKVFGGIGKGESMGTKL
jgi:hypothetical protein